MKRARVIAYCSTLGLIFIRINSTNLFVGQKLRIIATYQLHQPMKLVINIVYKTVLKRVKNVFLVKSVS